MARPDNFDMGIDSFNPDEINNNRNHRGRRRDNGSRDTMTDTNNVTVNEDEQYIAGTEQDEGYKHSNSNEASKSTDENNAQQSTADNNSKSNNVNDEQGKVQKSGIKKFFADERLKKSLGAALILFCVFMIIALVSHFMNGASDQSIIINTPLSDIPNNPEKVENATGGFGAWLSQVLLCDTLGVGSIVILIYACILAMGLLGLKKVKFWSLTFTSLLLAITSSIVLGLITYNAETAFKWGGTHGIYVNEFLIKYATLFGAIMVSILLVTIVLIVYINTLRKAWGKYKEFADEHSLKKQKQDDSEIQSEKGTANKDNIGESAKVEETDDEINGQGEDSGFGIEDGETFVNPQAQPVDDAPIFIETEATNDIINDDEEDETVFKVDDTTEESEIIEDEGETFTIYTPEIEEAKEIVTDNSSKFEPYDHRAELSRYKFPSIDLLAERKATVVINEEEQRANKERIVKTLSDYNIPISKIEATVGPTVTLYEIIPAEGVRISQIKRLEDDIALSLSALGIRIIAPIPGKGTVGIEVPNKDPQTVSMRSVISSQKYQDCKMALPMAIGATINNDVFIADLAKMPHLLVAGATGMGKSVGLNAIIASLLYKKHPSELKFVLVDPKMVEFSLYSKLERHYLAELPGEDDAIITDPGKVIQTLNSLCIEMDNRYALLRKAGVRSLEEYNKKFTDRKLLPTEGHFYMPYIVVIVDEFCDLIMMAGKEVETPIARIAQKARAVGMHMIIATQRPSANVITGIIKANFPGRIAFRVIQGVDSKTILDATGANQLIGKGDMLFSHNGSMNRVQCAFISTEEVEALTESIDNQVGYEHAYYLPEYIPEGAEAAIAGASIERDALFDEAARFIVQRQVGSTSMLQRQFNIGYNRAGRLMDQMEAAGIVGPVNGAKPRNILVDAMTLEQKLSQQ